MKSHPHNDRGELYQSIEDVPADVLAAYDAGRMNIPRNAYSGPTFLWSKLDWINVSLMPAELEVGDVFDEWSIGRWVFQGERDENGRALFTFAPKDQD